MPLYKDRKFDFVRVFVDNKNAHYAVSYVIKKIVRNTIKIEHSLVIKDLVKALKEKKTTVRIQIPYAKYGFKIKSFKHYK